MQQASNRPANPAAFPTTPGRLVTRPLEDGTYAADAYEREQGMTLRDYFAAQLMPTIVRARLEGFDGYEQNERGALERAADAAAAYQLADAMLAVRGKA